MACSLYAACRKGSTPTVGKGLMEGNCVSLTRILRTSKLRSAAVDSHFADTSRRSCFVRSCECIDQGWRTSGGWKLLLGCSDNADVTYIFLKCSSNTCNHPLSLIQFFSKMRKWADMSNLSQNFRLRLKQLERNFEVSMVIFRKFELIFVGMFQNPKGEEPPRKSRTRKPRHGTHVQVHAHTHTVTHIMMSCYIC